MHNGQPSRRIYWALLILVLLASVPLKLAAAHNIPWDIDYVPVIQRGWDFLQGNAPFPAYGTLSSVAAYNMPMLVWLHLPALALTGDAYLAMLLTMLTFNFVSTAALYRLGAALWQPRAGLLAAALFTFSPLGISGAYTSWAQHTLPGFFILTLLCLWEWQQRENGAFLAAAGVLAVAAFMTHFAAILLFPAMLLFALVTRARWQWRWLLIGAFGCGMLLAPYVAFQVQRDFVDVRAFLSQENLIADETLNYYETYNRRNSIPATTTATDTTAQSHTTTPQVRERPAPPPRWQRAICFALTVPEQYWFILNFNFQPATTHLQQVSPPAGTALLALMRGLQMAFWASVLWASVAYLRQWWNQRTLKYASHLLVTTPAGRTLLVFGMMMTVATGFILTRTIDQATYFLGLGSWQWLPVAYGVHTLLMRLSRRGAWAVLIALLASYIALNSAQRLARLHLHDDTQYSRYNIALYRHIDAAVDYIAADWSGEVAPTISYDIFPEMQNFWWVPAWNRSDEFYRMGMNFDFLLRMQHSIDNPNDDAIGRVDDADYIVVYEPGLRRYTLDQYDIARFGTIYVLTPTR